MKTKSIALGISMLLLSGVTLADDDCDDPVSGWQPRENLRQQLEAEGWTVYRIKVDDGCYEVKGRDSEGNRVEASFAPSSLELKEMEHEDDEYDEDDEYEDDDRSEQNGGSDRNKDNPMGEKPLPGNGIMKSRPDVTVQ
ncbi:hypothetical protein BKP64_05965 [Marinobacter salinus]|uniref:PepSY domain-containing protein n=1 Tax=Marinobacter salinus TaxID=1874317 RepID=A0A1D9GJF4_9GAMM|nr:PepSY domain-containing protein [Marinobacter salinus]AOY87753.1 hypothetical protein BKP64_05965 [Marinobacter salinus]